MTPEGVRVWKREKLAMDVSELVVGLLNREGIGSRKLAERCGRTCEEIDMLLDGDSATTIGVISDALVSLGFEFSGQAHELPDDGRK